MFNRLRADRLLSLGLLQPLLELQKQRSHRVPVLMYHGIREEKRSGSAYFETNTSPDVFAQQMAYLAAHGFRTISLDAALDPTRDKLQRAVVLTFDDGLADLYTTAMPVLARFGFTATVYIVSGFTEVASHSKHVNGEEYLTWRRIRELADCGVDIGSHTVNHPRLWTLPPEQVQTELVQSKCMIEAETGKEITHFSHPFAFPGHNPRYLTVLDDSLHKCNYTDCVSTLIGRLHSGVDRFRIPRLPVNTHDDAAFFAAKLDGAYDWLSVPQRLVKKVRSSAELLQTR
jgi:peptidoglycan/xylan/chitin deacetylase (PgdA/CDA1 family)